ncbi:MAG: TRZ/ATZ family hydrolase [Gammaproteobacteria bacterium]|nr:TRZ/ATZ family hydrolase [Gammaproteobacteria bacterium]MDH3373650.1 TRZ/ATZ family hydrolase [Gammaproteobacteria bacterium]MDH3408802.1 TRZ/ATZ family hydrolase [Gammaproteobacteria bacterium]MDH3552029.1 TRZ/ATZ family hydrolase [Gammaproteobacteria bacterium]
MQHCDTLILPGWCVPIEPRGTVLTDIAVAVTDGRIADVMPVAEAHAKYQPTVTIERPDHVLLPGLINAHTHAAMTLFRGLADGLPLEAWLRDGIWPAEKRWVSAEMVRDGTELAIAEMLRGGITCFSDQYFFPEIVAETAVDLHMRAVVGTPVVDFPTSWAADTAEYLSKGSDLVHDPYADHPLISTCFAPHSTDTLSDQSFVELRVLADQLDIPVQIHLHETATEITRSIAQTGKRPLQRLADLGLVNSSLLAVHGVHVTNDEIEQMHDAGVSVAHCPKSNLKLGSGFAPLNAYREAGVNVAIGTDGAASNNVLDILDELRIAALIANATSGDASTLGAEAALRMATFDAAEALGLGNEIGSIETGKSADLACIDLGRCNSQPVYDPVSQVVYTAAADQVSDVWVAGRQQLDSGRLTGIETPDLLARVEEWRRRIGQGTKPESRSSDQ